MSWRNRRRTTTLTPKTTAQTPTPTEEPTELSPAQIAMMVTSPIAGIPGVLGYEAIKQKKLALPETLAGWIGAGMGARALPYLAAKGFKKKVPWGIDPVVRGVQELIGKIGTKKAAAKAVAPVVQEVAKEVLPKTARELGIKRMPVGTPKLSPKALKSMLTRGLAKPTGTALGVGVMSIINLMMSDPKVRMELQQKGILPPEGI